MNNLHRELAPVTEAAWVQIEEEARRTFSRHVAARRVVDVTDPQGPEFSAVGDGHLRDIDPPTPDVIAHARTATPVIEWRVPFTVSRAAVDDVERGSEDSDWQPVKDGARTCAFAEDMAVIDGYAAAGITGLRDGSSHSPLPLPADARDYPATVSQALTRLRLMRRRRTVPAAARRRGVHRGDRDLRPRLPGGDPPGPDPGGPDPVGARRVGRCAAVHPGR